MREGRGSSVVLETHYSHKALETSWVIFIACIYPGSWLNEKPTAKLDSEYEEEGQKLKR